MLGGGATAGGAIAAPGRGGRGVAPEYRRAAHARGTGQTGSDSRSGAARFRQRGERDGWLEGWDMPLEKAVDEVLTLET